MLIVVEELALVIWSSAELKKWISSFALAAPTAVSLPLFLLFKYLSLQAAHFPHLRPFLLSQLLLPGPNS